MINKNDYSNEEIASTLHISNGKRRVSFRYDLLSGDGIKLGNIDCITGRISYGENRAIMRSAVFEVVENEQKQINFYTDMIQPWFVLHMDRGGTVEWPLGVFLLENPKKERNFGKKSVKIGAYDKSIILEEDRFTERFFVSAGTSYNSVIERILNSAGIYYSNIAQSTLKVADNLEYPTGTKKKLVVNELLRAMNFTPIFADENGILNAFSYKLPGDRPVDHSYSTKSNSIIHPVLTDSLELAGRANVFMRVASNVERMEMVSTCENNDPKSPLSTVRRGRRIVDYARIDWISDQNMLDIFVKRVAIERTSLYSLLTFNTVLMPTHGCFNSLFLDIPEVLDIPGKFTETAWDMDLRFDGVMRHEARRLIDI